MATTNPYDLAGRFRRGLDGSYVYLAQATVGGPVKVGATTDPISRLAKLQAGSPVELAYVTLLPGTQAHESYIHRLYAACRMPGEWFSEPALVVDFAAQLHDALNRSRARDARSAMVDAIRTIDPNLKALEQLWLNRATYSQIAELTGLPQSKVRRWLDAMRSMGFVLPMRYGYTSRVRDPMEESGIIVRRAA